MSDDRAILFVYLKSGKVRCLTAEQAQKDQTILLDDGWHHASTIDAARWIESIFDAANSTRALYGVIDELIDPV